MNTTTTIPTKASKARTRVVSDAEGVEHTVRFVKAAVEAPRSGTWAVAEIDGEGRYWIKSNGKAYGDPSLPSNYDVIDPSTGRELAYEGFDRADVIGWIIRNH